MKEPKDSTTKDEKTDAEKIAEWRSKRKPLDTPKGKYGWEKASGKGSNPAGSQTGKAGRGEGSKR